MKTLISTDTSCLVTNNVFDNYEISVFPLNVIIDGEEFLDGVTINQEELKQAMRANKSIKTSTPPLGSIIEYFENLFNKGYEHIIHFTISSKLSSMNSLFSKVAEENFKGKLTVIDSYSVSAPMLSCVFLAYESIKNGLPPEQVVDLVEKQKNDNSVFFIPENLTALKNGGRISPTIAVIGNIIGIKPVLILTDGQIEKTDTTRKMRATITEKISLLLQDYPVSDYDYSVINFDANEHHLSYIYDYCNNVLGDNRLIKGLIPINVCAHCGPGTIGVIATRKINGKSLKDYIEG
jgi:DegV family protein with EDD domain